MDLSPALMNLYPNADWYLKGYTYEGLVWNDKSIEKPSEEELTAKYEELVAAKPLKDLRKERDDLLAKTDKYALPDWPHASLEKQREWLEYRQTLRDLPANTEDPANPIWPVQPTA
jgi:hypothetical protein